MGRKFQHEIDSLRKSGAYKEALDLARYAHSQMSEHRLLKRSYAWAIYSYLKLKCAQVNELLNRHELSAIALIESKHPRVIEVNQLCREYRINKLSTADLCFSLLLRLLCRFELPPLGLYGLLKWSRSTGLRPEDYQVEINEKTGEKREPLLLVIAHKLEALVQACEHIDQEHPIFNKLHLKEMVEFVARLHIHSYESKLESTAQQKLRLLWTACWLYRRAGLFDQALKYGLLCFKSEYTPPSLWWEYALCLAQDSHNNETIYTLDQTALSKELSSALGCALYASQQARDNGINELHLVHLYAKIAVWAYHLDYLNEARILLTIAITLTEQNKQKVPFKWVATLSELGGPIMGSINLPADFIQQGTRDAQAWLSHKLES